MAKIALALVGLITTSMIIFLSPNQQESTSFQDWKQKHGITYPSQIEEIYREKIFLKNLAKIRSHNADPQRTFDMGVNQFTAMSNEEFKEMYLTLDVPKNIKKKVSYEDSAVGDVDWVDAGAVTPIKNQGQCGSCWAFSATGGMEGLSLFTTGDLHTFSEQQLVDCSGPYGNHGCQGGLMTQAYDYVIAKGVQYEDDYPYTARDQACKKEGGKFKIKAYKNIEDCVELANSLINRPVCVAVDADGWQMYDKGVFNKCDDDLNHGVTLVGMTAGYWKVKNSWGTTWGQRGYIKLARGNTCGICEMATTPLN